MARYVLYHTDVVTISNQAVRVAGAVYPIGHLTSVKLVEPERRMEVIPVTVLLAGAVFAAVYLWNISLYMPLRTFQLRMACVVIAIAGSLAACKFVFWPRAPKWAAAAVTSVIEGCESVLWRREPDYLELNFTNGDWYRITGDESAVRALHHAAVNAIGLAKA